MKYKVGDKVRVRKDLEMQKRYYMTDTTDCNFAVSDMIELRNKTVTISGVDTSGYRIKEQALYWWTDEMFEGTVCDKKIVITSDGVETLARLYENGKVVKKATAKCSPEDEFDFNVGAKLAFERLTEPAAEKKEEYYNGKVVCVKQGFRSSAPIGGFTKGKIYTVNDGALVADNGYTTERYRTLEELCTGIGYELIPVVE